MPKGQSSAPPPCLRSCFRKECRSTHLALKSGLAWEGAASCSLFNALGVKALAADVAGRGAVSPQPERIHAHVFLTERVKFSLPSREIVERPLENAAFKRGLRFSTVSGQSYNLPLPCSQAGLLKPPQS